MLRATFSGSAYVGVFARILGDVVLVRGDLARSQIEEIADELKATATPSTIAGSTTVGSLIAGNRHGAVITGQATDDEIASLSETLDRGVASLPDTMNAAGNVILANDHGAITHPELSEESLRVIEDTLEVPVERGTVGRVQTVGMAAVATTKGTLCHPQASDEELEQIEHVLDVPADLGTINYGSPLIGSGLIANEHGYVAGERTTGPELGRIEDALGLIE